jgi:hypothetical protein
MPVNAPVINTTGYFTTTPPAHLRPHIVEVRVSADPWERI